MGPFDLGEGAALGSPCRGQSKVCNGGVGYLAELRSMDAELRRAAEAQARRSAPGRPAKRRRVTDGAPEEAEHEELARYEYSGVDALLQDGRAFVVLCSFRRWAAGLLVLASIATAWLAKLMTAAYAPACCREKSATREAVQALSAYLQPAGLTANGSCTAEPACTMAAGPEPAGPSVDNPTAEPGSTTAASRPAASLAVVKVSCRGLVCLRLLGPGDPSQVVERLVHDVESGERPQLQCALPLHPSHISGPWRHRCLYLCASLVCKAREEAWRAKRRSPMFSVFDLICVSPFIRVTVEFIWH